MPRPRRRAGRNFVWPLQRQKRFDRELAGFREQRAAALKKRAEGKKIAEFEKAMQKIDEVMRRAHYDSDLLIRKRQITPKEAGMRTMKTVFDYMVEHMPLEAKAKPEMKKTLQNISRIQLWGFWRKDLVDKKLVLSVVRESLALLRKMPRNRKREISEPEELRKILEAQTSKLQKTGAQKTLVEPRAADAMLQILVSKMRNMLPEKARAIALKAFQKMFVTIAGEASGMLQSRTRREL